jgi:hypothetical protein
VSAPHAAVLALQRQAGNAAVAQSFVVQRSIVTEASTASSADLTGLMGLLNPKGEATNLWVTVDGTKLSDVAMEHPPAYNVWPLQSTGQGSHAEGKFFDEVLPRIARPRRVQLEITKSPCSQCTERLHRAKEEYPETEFQLRMIGRYPGSAREQGRDQTTPAHLVQLAAEFGADALDLRPIAARLHDQQWKWKLKQNRTPIPFAQRSAARDFAGSVVNALTEAKAAIEGTDAATTPYALSIPALLAEFTELKNFLNTKAGKTTATQEPMDDDRGGKRTRREEPSSSTSSHAVTREQPGASSTATGVSTTTATETQVVNDPDEWAQLKLTYPDLYCHDGQVHNGYYAYWSNAAARWFWISADLPE